MKKRYEIKTIKDICKIITKENKKNFLKDFSAWLDMHINLKERFSKDRNDISLVVDRFLWKDDGDFGVCSEINIQTKK